MAALRIGTRGSQLALWQAQHVANLLENRRMAAELEIIKTSGDRAQDSSFSPAVGKGIFIKEIEEALVAGEVDLAVHSLKDLPTQLDSHFEIAAVLKRAEARDALISLHQARLRDLPAGATIGTSSLRRQAQLRALRTDLRVRPLRGNVDTRLRKLQEGELEAMVLAAAGLDRLGKSQEIAEIFAVEDMCPAAGQGALAIEIRKGDRAMRAALSFLDDPPTRVATRCERALLEALGGGCQVPIGAYAEFSDGQLHLIAKVGAPDGSEMLLERETGENPQRVGDSVARKLRQRGAEEILRQLQPQPAALPQP